MAIDKKIYGVNCILKWFNALLVGLVVLVSSCGKLQEEQAEITVQTSLKTVYTVNYPLQYFAQRIAGDKLTVVFPMKILLFGNPKLTSSRLIKRLI